MQDGHGQGHTSDQRSSTGVQLAHGSENDWLIDVLHPHVLRLNQTFQFEISGYSAVQVLRYEPGQQYAWHVDLGRDDIATRKLSIIVLLSASEDYEGGELQWMPDLGSCPRTQGTLIAFSSFMPHRVTPVVRGVRHALVTWVHGDRPFM